MALVLVSGTQLEIKPTQTPLNKLFLGTIGILYLLAFPFFIFADPEFSLERSVNLMVWFILSFILIIGFLQICRTRQLRYSKLSVGLIVCCVLMTFPLFEHQSAHIAALPRIFALWLGLIFFLTLQQFQFTNKQKQRLLWFIVLSSVIECLIIDIMAYIHWGNNQHLNLAAFPSPKALTSYLLTGLLASGYLLAREAKKYQLKLSAIAIFYSAPVLIVPVIALLNSLFSWTLFTLCLATIYPYLIRFANHKRLITWSLLLITSLFISIGTLSLLNDSGSREPTDHATLNSPVLESLPQALDMFIEKPFTGYGYGRFEEKYVLYSARQHQLNPRFSPAIPNLSHPQNELLFWGIEGGIIPVTAIILAGLFVLIRNNSATKGTRLATLSLLLPIVLTSQFSDVLYQSHIHWISFIILLYWLDQRITKYRVISPQNWLTIAISRVGILVSCALFCFVCILAYNRFYLFRYTQTANISQLDHIHLPLMFKDQIFIARAEQLIEKDRSTEQFDAYIQTCLHFIRHSPTPDYYRILIALYQMRGEKNKELQTRLEAKFLFPDKHFLLEGPSRE